MVYRLPAGDNAPDTLRQTYGYTCNRLIAPDFASGIRTAGEPIIVNIDKRLEQRPVGAAGAMVAAPEARHRATGGGSPPDCQWHSVESANGSAVAGCAGAVRTVANAGEPAAAVAAGRGLGPALGHRATPGGRRRAAGLGCAVL